MADIDAPHAGRPVDQPFAGRVGKWVTTRHIRDRLHKEARHNIALRVNDTEEPDQFEVFGRGELMLAILAETMRRAAFGLVDDVRRPAPASPSTR